MPGGYKQIGPSDNPKPFEPGTSGNPKGRPVRVFSAIAKEFKERGIEKATESVVREAFEYLMALPVAELIDMAGNPKVENEMPALMRLMAKDMMGKNGLAAIREMLDRSHGKPKQVADITTAGESITGLLALPVEKQAEILRLINGNDAK